MYLLKRFCCYVILFISLSSKAQVKSNDSIYLENSKNVEIYYSLIKELQQLYVDTISTSKLVNTSIQAMLEELDPYTNYYPSEDVASFQSQSTGKYGGVGCIPIPSGDFIAIDNVFKDGPADKAGLKIGDVIIKIDEKSIEKKPDDAISKLIRGEPGTEVTFTTQDPISKEIGIKKIIREEISIDNISYSALLGLEKNIAYVRLSQFTERASNNIIDALDSLKKINANWKGVILDLRGNPGGLLDEATKVCNIFLPKNQLVVKTTRKVQEWQKNYVTEQNAWSEDVPLVVLINKSSASASEIVSGTMQDLDRGVIIGQKSFGKGLVQTTRRLPYNTQLKVTTAKYYTPSGRCIQALDYSNRNDDGSAGEVADSLRNTFETRKGRKVKDGGGIEPDVKLEPILYDKLIQALYSGNIIFDYCNKYARTHKSIALPELFTLQKTDLDNFVEDAIKKDFKYATRTHRILEDFKASAQKDSLFADIETLYDALDAKLKQDKRTDIIKQLPKIKRLIEGEIVKRYYYDKGKYKNNLLEDLEVLVAIRILNSPKEYAQLLGIQSN